MNTRHRSSSAWARRLITAASAAALAIGLAACAPTESTGPEEDGGTTQRGDELVVQFRGLPISLDPALTGTASGSIFAVLAYDPLIYQAPDGSLQPSLATEWGFQNDEKTAFEFTLRDDVTFADGAEMDAAAVKASMDYFLSKGGPNTPRLGPIEAVEVVDDSTVQLKYSGPFSDAAMTLTQQFMFGNVIGPDALSDPDSLLKTMDGAGQYVYNPDESVTDSTYVYDINPEYWNPEAQMWNRITVQIIADPNAVLNAATTGQIDFGLGSPLLASAAESAGLEIVTAPFYNWQLRLADMAGEINPALADERVRRAIGLALDRESIVTALGGEYMAVSDQLVVEGNSGYSAEIGWTFDLDEARSLMADAGYADGFSMKILVSSVQDNQAQIAQAVVSNLQEIGIDAELEVDGTSIQSFTEKGESKEFEAIIWPTNGDVGNAYRGFRQAGSSSNPFGFVDEESEALYAESLTVEGEERDAVFEELSARWQDVAMTIPIVTSYYVNYVGPDVTNVQASAANPVMLPVGPLPAYNWQPAQ